MKSILKGLGLKLIVFGCALMIVWPGTVLAQDPITIIDQSANSDFREHITFTLAAESTSEIVEATLFYQVVGQIATTKNEAEFAPGNAVTAEFEIDQTEATNYLPPGTSLNYWWNIVDAAGNELKTERELLLYLDDRYDWNTLENDRLTLYWYEGNDSFGRELFERANLALDTLETDVGIALENPIRIFIYANHRDLLGAISTGAQEWTGGQAFTRFGVVVIGVGPNQLDWGLNATTHEMTHLVIHQATENPFGDLPRWLDEGIAVYNENRDELDSDFKAIFDRAVERDELMTLRTLSSPFPSDPYQANLAYGQSGAVVKFIIDTYGTDAMAELLDIFSEGALYDEALEQALGVDTNGLDNAFRTSLGLPPLAGAEVSAPDEAEAAPETEPAAEVPEIEVEEEAEPAASAAEENAVVAEQPAQESSEESSTTNGLSGESSAEAEPSGSPLGVGCLGGLAPLFGLGLALSRVRRKE